jgi:hypothetical protein
VADPFSGHPLSGAGTIVSRNPLGQSGLLDSFGQAVPRTEDPTWAPPTDPLAHVDPRTAATIITREIPLVQVMGDWSPSTVRGALNQMMIGLFDQPSQLIEWVIADSRVQAAQMSRTGGLLGRPVKFGLAAQNKNNDKAKQCLEAWEAVWPITASEPVMSEWLQWSTHLGFNIAQIMWDTSVTPWVPHLKNWHPRYSYYHWLFRKYIAIGLDGQFPVVAGDGHWVLHAPHGDYRGWVRGAIRGVAPWWLARNYALRDWASASERNGMPTILADTPQGADPVMIQLFRAAVSMLGQNSTIQLPSSTDLEKYGKYDLRYLETKLDFSKGYEALIQQCNAEITLALQGQNLTSEVKEGSLAAAREHGNILQVIIEADARALEQTVRNQIMRPFAKFNFGDAELAPTIKWDVKPVEDKAALADVYSKFATFILEMARAGHKVTNPVSIGKALGLKLQLADIIEAPPLVGGGSKGKSEDSDEEDEDEKP